MTTASNCRSSTALSTAGGVAAVSTLEPSSASTKFRETSTSCWSSASRTRGTSVSLVIRLTVPQRGAGWKWRRLFPTQKRGRIAGGCTPSGQVTRHHRGRHEQECAGQKGGQAGWCRVVHQSLQRPCEYPGAAQPKPSAPA